jgi:integrase
MRGRLQGQVAHQGRLVQRLRREQTAKAVGVPEIGSRDLRRAHATWRRANVAPLEIVQQRLGHATLTTTWICLADVPDAEDNAAVFVSWQAAMKPVRAVTRCDLSRSKPCWFRVAPSVRQTIACHG